MHRNVFVDRSLCKHTFCIRSMKNSYSVRFGMLHMPHVQHLAQIEQALGQIFKAVFWQGICFDAKSLAVVGESRI